MPRPAFSALASRRFIANGIVLSGLLGAFFAATPVSAQFAQITTSPLKDRFPSWTPDGGSIVFESNRSGNWRLYIVPSTGGTATQVSAGVNQELQPSVSPDGTKIAFIRSTNANTTTGSMSTSSIWVMPSGGGTGTQITTSSGYLDWYPTWSLDGSTIYFSRLSGGSWNVWSVPSSGGVEAQVSISGQEHSIHFSPDGTHLAYAWGTSGAWNIAEALVSSPGVHTWQTSYGQTTVPNGYSPDGSHIVFVSRKDTGNLELYEVSTGTHVETRLTFDSSGGTDPLTNAASYSPDGNKIAFYSTRVTGEENIWVYDRTVPPPPANILTVGSGLGLPGGGVVHVPVSLTSDQSTSGLEFRLTDLPDHVTVQSVATSGRAAGMTAAVNDDGTAHIIVYNPTGGTIPAGGGPILDLRLAISGSAAVGDSIPLVPGSTILSSTSGGSIPTSNNKGYVKVGRRPGDLNGDNAVDVGDIVRLVEIILGTGNPPTAEELTLADCNHDTSRNVLDVTCLVSLVLASQGPRALPDLAALSLPAPEYELAAEEPVSGFQFLLEPNAPDPVFEGIEPFTLSTGITADGKKIAMAFDMSGGAWPADHRARFSAQGIIDVKAYGPGGRPLVVEPTNAGFRIGPQDAPPVFHVLPNAPNPFRGATTFRFSTGVAGPVTIQVFDIRGARVATIGPEIYSAGGHEKNWLARTETGQPLASGLYLARITTREGVANMRMLSLGQR